MNLSVDVYHLQPHDGTTRSGVGRQRPTRAERRDEPARNLHLPTPVPAVATRGSRADQPTAGDASDAKVDTHWTRILHHDFLNADAGPGRARSPLLSGALLLAVYVAMYLAVAAVIHVLASPDPAGTVAPAGPAAPASTAVASEPHVGEGASRHHGMVG